MSFSSLGLRPELLRAVADEGYEIPTPVQRDAIPLVLAGRDLLAGAQTGTGIISAKLIGNYAIYANSGYGDGTINFTADNTGWAGSYTIGSGAYRVASFEFGRSMVFERNPDWWAAKLPTGIGTNNFDRVKITYYRDTTVAMELAAS